MADEEEDDFAVKGVVRNGQVVLDSPLDVPDGTIVTLRLCEHGEIPAVRAEPPPLTEEQVRWLEEDIAWLRARAARLASEERHGREAA